MSRYSYEEATPSQLFQQWHTFLNSQMSFKITVSNSGDSAEIQRSPPELPDFFPKRSSIFERLPVLQRTQETRCPKTVREDFQQKGEVFFCFFKKCSSENISCKIVVFFPCLWGCLLTVFIHLRVILQISFTFSLEDHLEQIFFIIDKFISLYVNNCKSMVCEITLKLYRIRKPLSLSFNNNVKLSLWWRLLVGLFNVFIQILWVI